MGMLSLSRKSEREKSGMAKELSLRSKSESELSSSVGRRRGAGGGDLELEWEREVEGEEECLGVKSSARAASMQIEGFSGMGSRIRGRVGGGVIGFYGCIRIL